MILIKDLVKPQGGANADAAGVDAVAADAASDVDTRGAGRIAARRAEPPIYRTLAQYIIIHYTII